MVLLSSSLLYASLLSAETPPLPAHSKVLFIGDSITDMNRGRSNDPNHILGHSYAFLIGAQLGSKFPEQRCVFVNRGISGDKLGGLIGRWQADVLDHKPNIVSILVGINDVESGEPLDDFEAKLASLVIKTRASLPGVRIVLIEPFGLASGSRKARWTQLSPRLAAIQLATAKVARSQKTRFVPLQSVFDEAAKRAEPEYWIWDGIHPTYSGQQLIADAWLRELGNTRRQSGDV